MSLKSKGINAERDLIHKFWGTKSWVAVRVAGSGSMKYPCADILASNKLRKLAIECKVTKDHKKYFEKKEIEDLKNFADYFGAEPWIAVKFKGHEWLFVSLEDLEETDKCFVADVNSAKNKGLLFEEIVKN
ncbi:Holliday junction resolvase [archaeon]|jgi:Holliday junction resolvase|nr:Holliday junction resolvase [archaeon]MDP6548137.1 Holliday junction resolvase Hjc [Candidatus Woesearchaeota archaeon]|tara:strand:+ start:19952 stop:20344 length:393 start_codon:yes stop_codon:yes gene_type:complete